MHRNKSVDTHAFSMIPRADIPRSRFKIETSHKTTLDSGYLVPIYVDEVLPGDTFSVHMTAFGRLSTPIVPIMDNIHLESFFFFVPNRLVWNNWHKMMGEQENPGDSISYLTPQVAVTPAYVTPNEIFDYMGIPGVGQATNGYSVNALPLRAYNLIWNEWFRDENLCVRTVVNKGDGPDVETDYQLRRRGKRHDYFTSCLPWVQKGASVALPLGSLAPVKTADHELVGGLRSGMWMNTANSGGAPTVNKLLSVNASREMTNATASGATGPFEVLYPSNLYADLSAATAATINQIRQAFQIQKLLERDARGGTRYTELIRSHFGVISPDARLQRPEYLGGGHTMVNVSPVTQTSGTGQTGQTTPLGFLAAVGTVTANGHGFTQSFTEHGFIIGMVSIRADLSYQQGLRKMWSRRTRYDYYWPVFAMLGEQAVLNKEIYCTGLSAQDDAVFGYQERWAEYRHNPAMISGFFRSTAAGTLDPWHLAQKFTALPTLNSTFIEERPPIDRIVATTPSTGKQFLLDCFFHINATRPMPTFSVPGLVDHF